MIFSFLLLKIKNDTTGNRTVHIKHDTHFTLQLGYQALLNCYMKLS